MDVPLTPSQKRLVEIRARLEKTSPFTGLYDDVKWLLEHVEEWKVVLWQSMSGDAETIRELRRELESVTTERDELLEAMSQTCETPADGCQCAGCLALAEHAERENG